jgi:hypothetical protein
VDARFGFSALDETAFGWSTGYSVRNTIVNESLDPVERSLLD